jgi:glycosyltransferase involved in cell wall biosynthesis
VEADTLSTLADNCDAEPRGEGEPFLPTYSLVIPAHNEEGVMKELAARLAGVMDALDGDAEAILVDDGSRDRTYELMLEAASADPRFRLIRLSRNFGHQIALTAGVDLAAGDAVIVLDADLQDPPEVILELAARWREGYDVVYAVRDAREGETRFKRATATAFYRAFNRISEVEVPVDDGDFRLVDRRARHRLVVTPVSTLDLVAQEGVPAVAAVVRRAARGRRDRDVRPDPARAALGSSQR